MKTAIYIEDGITQIVLTPENDFEKNAIDSLGDDKAGVTVIEGSFYECRGGWTCQKGSPFQGNHPHSKDDKSLIIRVKKP